MIASDKEAGMVVLFDVLARTSLSMGKREGLYLLPQTVRACRFQLYSSIFFTLKSICCI